jgi:hypothetical protein
MAPYSGRRIFRSSPLLLVLLAAAELLFLAGTWVLYRYKGLALTTLTLGGLSVFGAIGLLDALTRRVVLAPDALLVTGLWGRRRYDKGDIVTVSQEKGGPPALKLADGRWARLPPEIGQAIGNSIRAWLKAES